VWRSLLDGLAMGVGFTLVLLALGAIREILGHGTLLAQADLLFGEGAEWLTITLFEDYRGYLLAILPPGAFLILGLLIALKNIVDKRLAERAKQTISVQIQAETAN
ncbi:MAG: electron transport complex subunit RsxE, partial [Gammaproteobacteria bacterium]|nr:electron transport complex subunit RsxE [Gammaproteobacteria bacterium]